VAVALLVLGPGVTIVTAQQQPAPAPVVPGPTPGPTQPEPAPVPPSPVPAEEEPPPPTIEVPVTERPPTIIEDPIPTEGFAITVPTLTIGGSDFFNPPAPRGRVTLVPSLTLSGEYNDNVDATPTNRHSDFIIALTPGVTLAVQQPQYRIHAGYNTSAEFYLDETERNTFGKRHRLYADVFYRHDPRLTFTLNERFIFDRDSDLVTAAGVSTGRRDAYRNTITPALRWQATQLTAVRVAASYTLLRFDEAEDVLRDSRDSDVFRLSFGADRQFSPRLIGSADLGLAYFDVEREPEAFTYTPTVGVAYQLTRTLRAAAAAGVTLLQSDGDVTASPAARLMLAQTFRWGTAQIGYDRGITADGIGVTDRQTIVGAVRVRTLMRGLLLEFLPRYTIADVEREGRDRDVKSLTLNLRATYQLTRSIAMFGAYTFFDQRSSRASSEYDQNRVMIGLQYAYPINFD
jgi:hypothetical protein